MNYYPETSKVNYSKRVRCPIPFYKGCNTSDKNNKYYGVRGSSPNDNYYTNIQEFVGPEMEHKDIVNVPVVRKYILDIIIPNNNYNI